MPCSSTASTSKKSGKVLACSSCQQRKKKCDKRSPCSFCIKNNTACVPSTPAVPKRRRQPTRELLERMSRCEDLLRQCLDQGIFVQKQQSQQDQVDKHDYHKQSLDEPSSNLDHIAVDKKRVEDEKVDTKVDTKDAHHYTS